MTFTEKQNSDLAAPLNRANVKTRSQSGRSLSYIEGWRAIDEANRIFGFDGWTRETIDIKCVADKPREIGALKTPGFGVSYTAKVRINVNGIIREGIGAGHGIDRDLGQAHESAIKEAETDAMKRALMTFGNPFGLALYDKTQSHVADAPQEPARIQRKSSAQATRDGDHTRYIDRVSAADAEGLAKMEADIELDTAAMPQSWLDPMRDKIILRREELNPVEGAGEMDEAYRATVG